MKKIASLLFCCLFTISIFSQKKINSKYFQQEVNYKMEVTLDDANHKLYGVAEIEYINHSPDILEKIDFHLWANAYKNQSTAFAKQQVRNGYTKFFFAKNNERGGYEEIDFLINGENLDWNFDEKNIDIAYVDLKEKLNPGGRVNLRVPFVIKIPNYFSRMGHVDQAYYISQWYPKPAVYDAEGWHPMPYLDTGEFYSEFGKYDVKITLPKNYYVASTGQLQTKNEMIFNENRVRETNKFISENYPSGADRSIPLEGRDTFPESDEEMKSIHFTAENVHDFAWFADKRFFIQKSRVPMGEDNFVETWAFFNKREFHLWLNATKYLNQSVQFYSQNVGVYPYPHATAVSNPYAGAGAMEYPMVTLVDRMGDAETLDIVIAHEVGHNWFYGILAFNERDYAWLDEGINSYYEKLYTQNFYPDKKNENFLPKVLQSEGQLELMELAKVSMQRENVHQAITTHPNEMTEINYGLGSYDRTAEILKGRITPVQMKSFFNKWKFKHPQPEDFISHFNLENDQVFKDWMTTTKKVDYQIKSVSKKDGGYFLKIKNKRGIAIPFDLSMIAGDRKKTQMVDGFTGEKIIEIPAHNDGLAIDKFMIDKDRKIPDVNRKNNNIRTSGLFKKTEPLRLKFLSGIEDPTRTTLFWLPALAWNNTDKTMLGVVLHNFEFTPKNFEFTLAPMYGFASRNLVGSGVARYNFFPENSLFQKVTLSMNAKRFSQRYNWSKDFYDDYLKLSPKLEFFFKKKKLTSSVQQSLSFRFVNISLNNGFTTIDNPDEIQRNKTSYFVNELKYTFDDKKVTSPLKVEATIHQSKDFLKIFATAQQFIPFNKKNKGVKLRAFVGYVPLLGSNSKIGGAGALSLNGITSRLTTRDYLFDENLFGRSVGRGNNSQQGSGGILSQQVFMKDAGFKTLSDFASPQNWLISLGVSTSVPGPLPVRPYADAAITKNIFDETVFAFSAGVSIVAIPDAIEIYFPLWENKEITDGIAYEVRDTFWKRISFLVDLNELKKTGKGFIQFY